MTQFSEVILFPGASNNNNKLMVVNLDFEESWNWARELKQNLRSVDAAEFDLEDGKDRGEEVSWTQNSRQDRRMVIESVCYRY